METVSGREFVFVAWENISQPLQLTLFPGRRHKKSLKAHPLHDLLEDQVYDNTFAARFVPEVGMVRVRDSFGIDLLCNLGIP